MRPDSTLTSWRSITILGLLAGIVYCSWPLGYWLNPAVSRGSLASGLEAVGQPYSWLFIAADCLSGLLMLVMCGLLWIEYRHKKHRPLLGAVLIAVAGFGIGTIVDSLLPEHCVPVLQTCASFRQDHLLLVHGIFSILASVSLFVSLCLLWWRQRLSHLLNGVIVAYILFGVISLIEAVMPGWGGNWSQHYYITLCSLWLVLLPFAIHNFVGAKKNPDL